MTIKTAALAIALALVLTPMEAHATEPRLIGTFGDWSAYTFMEGANKVCYMAARPKKSEGAYSQRGNIHALITHRPGEGTRNVFSYIAGYAYKPDSEVTISAAGQTFKLFTQDETAWASDAESDNRLVDSIRKGSSMVVKGVSQRGTKTTDTFGLKGSSDAHDSISRECGL